MVEVTLCDFLGQVMLSPGLEYSLLESGTSGKEAHATWRVWWVRVPVAQPAALAEILVNSQQQPPDIWVRDSSANSSPPPLGAASVKTERSRGEFLHQPQTVNKSGTISCATVLTRTQDKDDEKSTFWGKFICSIQLMFVEEEFLWNKGQLDKAE